jgi:hypothetical protein
MSFKKSILDIVNAYVTKAKRKHKLRGSTNKSIHIEELFVFDGANVDIESIEAFLELRQHNHNTLKNDLNNFCSIDIQRCSLKEKTYKIQFIICERSYIPQEIINKYLPAQAQISTVTDDEVMLPIGQNFYSTLTVEESDEFMETEQVDHHSAPLNWDQDRCSVLDVKVVTSKKNKNRRKDFEDLDQKTKTKVARSLLTMLTELFTQQGYSRISDIYSI